MIDIPKVSVQPDGATFRLFVTSYGSTAPAGPRLLRGLPHPKIEFSGHATLAAAEADAAKLTVYIDETWTTKTSKAKARKEGM